VNAVYPRIAYLVATDAVERANRLRTASVCAVLGFGMAGAAGLWVFAPLIVRIVFGSGFEESVGLLRVLCLVLPLVALSSIVASGWLLVLGKDRAVMTVTMIVAAVNVCLALVLAPLFGATGMAWGVVAAEATAATAVVVAVLRLRGDDRCPPTSGETRSPATSRLGGAVDGIGSVP
jgi:PST family polysaccharide transporter